MPATKIFSCGAQAWFSRMLRRRVPVLRLGSRGPGGDARSLRLRTQASAIVRKRPRSVGHAWDMPETKIVAKRRTVVTFGLVSGLRISKVSTVTGIGGSWSRNAELSSLLDSSPVFASQKCQQSLGSGGSWSRNAELASLLALPLERGEERGERREEKREMRGEQSGERTEERREERDERREKRGEKRDERREERRERREKSRERREERRVDRREERGEERRQERREERRDRREKRGEKRERWEEREVRR